VGEGGKNGVSSVPKGMRGSKWATQEGIRLSHVRAVTGWIWKKKKKKHRWEGRGGQSERANLSRGSGGTILNVIKGLKKRAFEG